VKGRIVSFPQRPHGHRVTPVIRERPAAGNGVELGKEVVAIAVFEEQSTQPGRDALRETARATANHGHTPENGLGCHQSEGLGPEGRRDECPGVGQPLVDFRPIAPAAEFDGFGGGELPGEGCEGGPELAVADDSEACVVVG